MGQGFGTATLQSPPPLHATPQRRCPRYNCGRHGKLSVAEIAAIAGTSKTAIFKRIKRGYRGEKLCVPRWSTLSDIRRLSPPQRHILVAAFQIAELYPDRMPSIHEIRALRPMSVQNAQHWRQAIATARFEADALSTTGRTTP